MSDKWADPVPLTLTAHGQPILDPDELMKRQARRDVLRSSYPGEEGVEARSGRPSWRGGEGHE